MVRPTRLPGTADAAYRRHRHRSPGRGACGAACQGVERIQPGSREAHATRIHPSGGGERRVGCAERGGGVRDASGIRPGKPPCCCRAGSTAQRAGIRADGRGQHRLRQRQILCVALGVCGGARQDGASAHGANHGGTRGVQSRQRHGAELRSGNDSAGCRCGAPARQRGEKLQQLLRRQRHTALCHCIPHPVQGAAAALCKLEAAVRLPGQRDLS